MYNSIQILNHYTKFVYTVSMSLSKASSYKHLFFRELYTTVCFSSSYLMISLAFMISIMVFIWEWSHMYLIFEDFFMAIYWVKKIPLFLLICFCHFVPVWGMLNGNQFLKYDSYGILCEFSRYTVGPQSFKSLGKCVFVTLQCPYLWNYYIIMCLTISTCLTVFKY